MSPADQEQSGKARIEGLAEGTLALPAADRCGNDVGNFLLEFQVSGPNALADRCAPVEPNPGVVFVIRYGSGKLLGMLQQDLICAEFLTRMDAARHVDVKAGHFVQHGVDQCRAGGKVHEHGGQRDLAFAGNFCMASFAKAASGKHPEGTL